MVAGGERNGPVHKPAIRQPCLFESGGFSSLGSSLDVSSRLMEMQNFSVGGKCRGSVTIGSWIVSLGPELEFSYFRESCRVVRGKG